MITSYLTVCSNVPPFVCQDCLGCDLVLGIFQFLRKKIPIGFFLVPPPLPGNQTGMYPLLLKVHLFSRTYLFNHSSAFSSTGERGTLFQIVNLLPHHHLLDNPTCPTYLKSTRTLRWVGEPSSACLLLCRPHHEVTELRSTSQTLSRVLPLH